MAGKPPNPTKAAEPRFGRTFDPWNSVALGHQRAETKGPERWRENRTRKLGEQLLAGNTGGQRRVDSVGAGSDDFDDKNKVLVPKAVRARAVNSVVDMLRTPGAMSTTIPQESPCSEAQAVTASSNAASAKPESTSSPKLFDGLVIYVNGSTHPLISDHKLKHVLAENGARMSIHLGRRQVTHVIVGRPTGFTTKIASGAGGGLSGSKIDKEIRRIGGCGVKYVGVEWILDSVKAGRRLPEAKYGHLKVASKGQPSVYRTFSQDAP